MPYTVKGKCVYKKDTGKKVGCTKGNVDDYLAALHANANESIQEDSIKGGKADKLTKQEIADRFNVSLSKIEKEVRDGIKVEMEHTNSKSKAEEIAMDHLSEFPDYYTRLEKMEKDGKKRWGKKRTDESMKQFIRRALNENFNFSVTDETSDSTEYNVMHNNNVIGSITLSKHNKTISKDGIELVNIKIDSGYRGLKTGAEIIKNIWATNPDINTIYLMPTSQSRAYWEKMGAVRLNDTYSIIQRGH